MKKYILVSIVCALVLGGYLWYRHNQTASTDLSYKTVTVTLGGQPFVLDIADTEPLRERGLSYRQSLKPRTGMLFVFNIPGVYYFWMKDMNFPIDMVWLDMNKKIVYIKEHATPESYPASFGPTTQAQYVIEIGDGMARMLGLSVGDKIDF